MKGALRWMRFGLVLSLAFGASLAAGDEQTLVLPRPSGPDGVGTMVWHWIDEERPDELSADSGDRRAIMAQVWYPATVAEDAPRAPYAPLHPELTMVRPWSVPSAPLVAAGGRLPVVVLSPGRGMARHFYTGVAEDLASHGYLVLAVDSPYIGRVIYPDGRLISPDPRFRPSRELMMGPYEEVDRFFEPPTALGAGDIAFALRRLAELDRADPSGRLTGRVDLGRLGVFGHSLGGRIAGAVTGSDERVRAFAAMEGVAPRKVRQGGLDAAALVLYSSSLPDIAQPNLRDIIANRRNDVFLARLEGFGHNSVTDLPLLDPATYGAEVDSGLGLERTRALLRSFFDRYVRQRSVSFNALGELPEVTLEHFPAPPSGND
ncbi:MAG: hypothetical protein AAF604_17860 [Acidobacteriota bacterium]